MKSKHTKATALADWRRIPDNLPILPQMAPIPYKARGSRYGACGIRIDGTPAFIDAVLSRLKDVMAGENHTTRLELARHAVDGSGLDKSFDNAESGAEVCYIRLHERGRQAAMASILFDRQHDAAQLQYEGAGGVL